ncbi:hypothetical protein [Streptomyces sp. NBC_00687]|uniref:hypothetical protein n=1 Tax=Streptomyces sp. NBC_00687 TaxID=2975807 RepID=UPI002257AB10|nr:hypothetical protein [Streptomyces sp. NBC_00687]MCX4919827.1 hypothetical protein [Streptomyces sp. NBC_00687]
MATFAHITPARCTQLGNALTAAGLTWQDNGNHDRPELLTYTVTDPHDRRWTIEPATSNQITPSRPASLWQAACTDQFHRSDVLSARAIASLIHDHEQGADS